MQANDVIPSDKPEFTLQRVFHAPRELVYMIWTQPEYVKQWWGVDDCAIVVCELDVRPGGSFRIDMKTADGNVYVNRGVYIDVVPNERLVTKDERDEGVLPGNIPAGIHTVTFEDVDGDTVVTLTSRFAHIQDRDLLVSFGIVDGIRQSLNRFQQLVALVTLQRERKTS